MPLYAAYGSNMHPEQMLQRAPHSPMAGTGWLHGWRLTFGGEDIGWEGALATIVEDPDSKVFVVLYDMTKEDEKNLDRWEGSELGIHKKIRCLSVKIDDKGVVWNCHHCTWSGSENAKRETRKRDRGAKPQHRAGGGYGATGRDKQGATL